MKRQGVLLHAIDYHATRLLRRVGVIWFALLAGLALLALVLGTVGFHRVASRSGRSPSLLDDAYQALQLFVLEAPDLGPDIPATLDLARFLAAFVSFSAVIGLLGKVFDQQLQAIRLRLLGRDHVIVCGLGEKGGELVEPLRRQFHFVVVIEPDPAHEDLAHCRAAGAVTLIGSSADAWQLRKARVRRAGALLAVFQEEDRLNVETAVLAFELSQAPRRGVLTCVFGINDPDLAAVIRKHEMAINERDWFDLQFFSLHEACARAMLREAFVGLGGSRSGHVLVAGLGKADRLGELLILRAAKDWSIDGLPGGRRLLIEVVDPESRAKVDELRARHPYLDRVAEFEVHELAPEFADRAAAGAATGPPDVAFVCLEDEPTALIAADRLRTALPSRSPVVVRTAERDAGIGALIRGRASERLIAVGIKDRLFQLATSLRPVEELLAQAVHQEYLNHHARLGADDPAARKPAVSFWEDLPDSYREANRAQARDIRSKLDRAGRRAVHAPDSLIENPPFPDDELDRLARDEHDRWCIERRARGWTHGPVRDEAARTHPDLVDWSDPRLGEPARDIDRNAVRRLPAILAMADYRIVGPDDPEARPRRAT